MKGLSTTTTTSLRAVRARAQVPRALFYGLVTILAFAGLRSIAEGSPTPVVPPPVVQPTPDPAAMAFAESFTRAYLSWDPEDLDARRDRLQYFLAAGLDEDAGLSPAGSFPQEVTWTSVAGTETTGPRTVVTVAAAVAGDIAYLAVPVERIESGRLRVTGYPSLVGPPASDPGSALGDEPAVDDPALETVVERAVRNYLAGAHDNLLADLSPDAVVSLPAQRLAVDSTEAITWAAPGERVAVTLRARDDRDNQWRLRYELAVIQRDRWYVQSVATDPTYEEYAR